MPSAAEGTRSTTRGSDLLVGALLVLSIAATVGFAATYVADGQVQLLGLCLGVATAALAVAIGLWAKRFMPQGPVEEERPRLRSTGDDRAAVFEILDQGERSLTRRRLLTAGLIGAVGSLAVALLLPFRSLGPFPLPGLRGTAWAGGSRLVDEKGRPLRVGDVPVDGIITAFPEGATTRADREAAQVVLIRLGSGVTLESPARPDWAPAGHIAYSKVCTHAGCPVGLYQAETHQLVCPCHQSLFDVIAGARPVFGPATRALPQLPLRIDGGYLVASSDFAIPPGPASWNVDRP